MQLLDYIFTGSRQALFRLVIFAFKSLYWPFRYVDRKAILKALIWLFYAVLRVFKTILRETFWTYLKYHYDRFQAPRSFLDLWFRLAFRFLLVLSYTFLFLILAFSVLVTQEHFYKYIVSCIAPVYFFTRKSLILSYISIFLLAVFLSLNFWGFKI